MRSWVTLTDPATVGSRADRRRATPPWQRDPGARAGPVTVGALPGPAAPDRSITRRPAQLTTPGRGNWRSQALQQWNGTGALGDENSDVENLAHNIQIGTPRSQIQQSSPKRQIGGSARGYPRPQICLVGRLLSTPRSVDLYVHATSACRERPLLPRLVRQSSCECRSIELGSRVGGARAAASRLFLCRRATAWCRSDGCSQP